jgi:hypothetical protein
MFNLYPKIDYKINDFDSLRAVDITISAKIKKYLNSYRAVALRPYIVKNGEFPELVSNRIYGSPKYSYILISVNNIHSIYDDWPKSDAVFSSYIEEKYGSISYALSTNHSWYTGDDHSVSEEYWLSISDSGKYIKTIYQYESDLNDKKANINIMDFRYVIDFESKLQEILVSN